MPPCRHGLEKPQNHGLQEAKVGHDWLSVKGESCVADPGPCITNIIATCRKNFSQWERGFLWKPRCHWLKFLRRVAKMLVIQGPAITTNYDTTNKGSMTDSSSTTYPMGASISAILFSFVLEKYIVCDVCGLRSPSFESSNVLHFTPTDTSSMQDLILQGLQQKRQKYCSRCNKNTWHV